MEQERTIVRVDGMLVDDETGEVIALVEPAEPFAVKDESSAEWLLKTIAHEEAKVKALMNVPEYLEAQNVLTRTADLVSRATARVDWLKTKYEAELREFVENDLAFEKSRTWRCKYGEVALKATQARITITDKEKAVAYAKATGLPVKVTEEVQVSAVKDAMLAMVKQGSSLPEGYDLVPAGTNVHIKAVLK